MKVVFFGSSQNTFSNRFYEALGQAACEMAAAVDVPPAKRSSTNPARNAEATDFARDAARRGLPVYEPANPNAPEFVAAVRSLAPDLFLAVGYMLRLGPEMLAVPRIVSANVHASLLPAYRGRSPVFWALRNGERYSGLTIHVMDDRLDTGDLLYQVRVRTRRDDTVASLYDRIIAKGLSLVPRLIADARRGRLPRKAQPTEGGSYFSAAREADFCVDWSEGAEKLSRWINITPGKCFATIRGERVYLWGAKVAARSLDMPAAGTLLKIAAAGCTIAAGQGAVRLGRVQLASGRQLSLSDFCRQAGLTAGDLLCGPPPQNSRPIEVY
jgi:methionyl-tRNA formyltransferase